jgi:hypothetical protein
MEKKNGTGGRQVGETRVKEEEEDKQTNKEKGLWERGKRAERKVHGTENKVDKRKERRKKGAMLVRP